MHPFESSIARVVRQHSLIQSGDSVLVAVSGGPDSTALLHVLVALRREWNLELRAMYVNHSLRPKEARIEQDKVLQMADACGVPSSSVRVDTPAHVTARKISTEHAARELRYQELRKGAGEYAAKHIAVGHTSSDQVEQLLLRMIRGGGRKALSGMMMQNGPIIRPLLTTSKEQVLSYLTDKNISYCWDSSNDDLGFLRNRIRLQLLPLLEEQYDPGIRQALLKTATNLAQDESLLKVLLDKVWEKVVSIPQEADGGIIGTLNKATLVSLHPALQRRLVERFLWQIGTVVRYDHILQVQQAAAHGRTGSELHLSKGLRVGVTRELLEFSYPQGKGAWRGRLYSEK